MSLQAVVAVRNLRVSVPDADAIVVVGVQQQLIDLQGSVFEQEDRRWYAVTASANRAWHL